MEITKEELADLYLNKKWTPKKIAEHFGFKSRTSINSRLKKYGIPIRSFNQKYWPNEDAFSFWSHSMAYCLGFLCGDGHIWKDRPFLTVGIHKQDKEILEFLVRHISPQTKIRNANRNKMQICIRSQQIWSDLNRLGCTHDKTFNMGPPNAPDEFFGDWLRGFFDADGCIYGSRKRRDGSYYYISTFATASRKMAYELQARLGMGKIRMLKDKYYELSFPQGETIKLGEKMYGCHTRFRLRRKYEKFKLINNRNKFWTPDEIKIIKSNLEKPAEQLKKLLPDRKISAIQRQQDQIKQNI